MDEKNRFGFYQSCVKMGVLDVCLGLGCGV